MLNIRIPIKNDIIIACAAPQVHLFIDDDDDDDAEAAVKSRISFGSVFNCDNT